MATALILSIIFKHNWWHLTLLYFLGDKGNPKYLIGKDPKVKPIIYRISIFVVSSNPAKYILDLSVFASKPVTREKYPKLPSPFSQMSHFLCRRLWGYLQTHGMSILTLGGIENQAIYSFVVVPEIDILLLGQTIKGK